MRVHAAFVQQQIAAFAVVPILQHIAADFALAKGVHMMGGAVGVPVDDDLRVRMARQGSLNALLGYIGDGIVFRLLFSGCLKGGGNAPLR